MDPRCTLMDASAAIKALSDAAHDSEDTDAVDAYRTAMDAYRDWRRKGGFEPTVMGMRGDDYHRHLRERFARVARIASDADNAESL